MLNELRDEIHQNAVEHGFWRGGSGGRGVPEVLMLCASELFEALEEYRTGEPLTAITYELPGGKPLGFSTELADAIIRILDACGAYGIDIDAVLLEKMEYNKTRPPMHGKIC